MARLGHMLAGGDSAALAHFAEHNPNHTADAPLSAAMRWFRKAQSAGDGSALLPSALLGMAALHMYGNGTAVDHGKAFELLSAVVRADGADAEVAEAKYLLGVMWRNGWGVSEPSDVQAHRLFSEAAMVRALFLRMHV